MVQDDDVKEGHIFDNMLVGDIDNLRGERTAKSVLILIFFLDYRRIIKLGKTKKRYPQ